MQWQQGSKYLAASSMSDIKTSPNLLRACSATVPEAVLDQQHYRVPQKKVAWNGKAVASLDHMLT